MIFTGKEYSKEFTITYFGTDDDLMLKPSSLAVYFQDLAIGHSDSLGYTLELLGKWNKGWAITNWHIVVDRFPKCGEKIKITTWSNYCRRMQAQRYFKVEDQNGQIICVAASRWIFMDLVERKPSRIPEEMEEAYLCSTASPIENEKYSMPKAFTENHISSREFIVTRRDTDTNGHANNTKYIEWAIDDIPDDIYENYRVFDMKVVYRKECYKGSRVLSKCYVKDIDGKKEIISFFCDALDNSVVFCEVATVWILK